MLLRQGQHGCCFKKPPFQNVEGSRSLLLQLLCALFEPLLGFLLRVGLKNLIEQLVHPIAITSGRLVQNVPPEVGSASLPDAPREGRSEGGLKPFMSVTGGKLHSPKPTTGLQILEQLLPALSSLSKGDLEAENLPLAVLADADCDHRSR
jgi:hypothetical protein